LPLTVSYHLRRVVVERGLAAATARTRDRKYRPESASGRSWLAVGGGRPRAVWHVGGRRMPRGAGGRRRNGRYLRTRVLGPVARGSLRHGPEPHRRGAEGSQAHVRPGE